MIAWQKFLVANLVALYALLLRLYPRPFRETFAEEMNDVFARRIAEMAQGGFFKLFHLCLREYADLSRLLLAERWSQLGQGRREMKEPVDTVHDSRSVPPAAGTPGSWFVALLAGLPHLLVPAFLLTGWLLHTLHIPSHGPYRNIMEISFSALVALMLIVAWLRGWPRWSGSWAGYASATLFILLLSALTYIFNTYPVLTEYAAIVENVPVLVWLLFSMVMLVLLARRDPLAGLLAVLSISVVITYIGLDEVRGDEPLFLGIALGTAIVAVFVARAKQPIVGLGLVLATLFPVAFMVSYYSIYRSTTFPGEPSLSIVIRQTIILFIVFGLWLIPTLILFAWRRLARWRMSL